MSFWSAAVIIVAIWAFVQVYARRHDRELGVTRDEDGNPVFAPRGNGRDLADIEAARREVGELRERVKVLERIVTEGNTGEAREQARIAAEIEALRGVPAGKTGETDQ